LFKCVFAPLPSPNCKNNDSFKTKVLALIHLQTARQHCVESTTESYSVKSVYKWLTWIFTH